MLNFIYYDEGLRLIRESKDVIIIY